MIRIECGFDKTLLPDAMTWLKIQNLCKLNGFKELDGEAGFLWTGQNLRVLTGDDPMTGNSRIKALNHPGNIKPGWLGYVGVEGEPTAVLEFVGLVFLHAEHVKDFDPKRSSFITLPKVSS